MLCVENVSLATLTTLKVGGVARFVYNCESEVDVLAALAFARENTMPWYVLGSGSNVLAADEGYEGVIIHMTAPSIVFDENAENDVQVVVDAGVMWDEFVHAAGVHELWGIENLAGIPGTVGAAPVQNIGAYGAEVSTTLLWVEGIDTHTNQIQRFACSECKFGYRESRFKNDPSFIITKVAFVLSRDGTPHISYADLAAKAAEGIALTSPQTIARAVRDIRARKFPDLRITGTAGSFFKNPVITTSLYDGLVVQYPNLPCFQTNNAEEVKVPLAWILDKVLGLRGYRHGFVGLYEMQPLVLVTNEGASAGDVEALAHDVEKKVFEATGIRIEREVRMLRNS